MQKIVNVAASPVIFKDKYLLIKRIKEPYTNLWSLVGGKIEFGENIEETIIREVLEETGLKVKFIAVRGVVVEHLMIKGKTKEHFIIWVCETKAKQAAAKEQNEGQVKWFTKNEIKKIKKLIIPSDYQMIEAFFFSPKRSLPVHKSKMIAKGKTYELEYFGS